MRIEMLDSLILANKLLIKLKSPNFRYVLHSGEVKSKDGDIHHITSNKLMDLYGLKIKECLMGFDVFRCNAQCDEVHLYPREEGDYQEYLLMIQETYLKDYEKRKEELVIELCKMNSFWKNEDFMDWTIDKLIKTIEMEETY